VTGLNLPALRIGDITVEIPIIQGGMGVRVSGANLAAAVANTGCIGVISSVGIGPFEGCNKEEAIRVCEVALRSEIKRARTMTDGIIGVNIMVASSDYPELVRASIAEGIDLIISGAGLPLDLPKYLNGAKTKLVPIVSSGRALKVLCRKWEKSYRHLPDAVVVEGPMAGGHLGYRYEELIDGTAPLLEDLVGEVIKVAHSFDAGIPVIAAGGIFDGGDIVRFLGLGAAGVQMGTRFVCTDECDVHINFKKAYLNAKKTDLHIIKSPVGLPGRVIKSGFVERIEQGHTMPFKCDYRCLRTCNPSTSPYCIANVLSKAANGYTDESFCFAGSNAYRCNEIVPVKVLVQQLMDEMKQAQCSGKSAV
jgi:nitronate monooxygenase